MFVDIHVVLQASHIFSMGKKIGTFLLEVRIYIANQFQFHSIILLKGESLGTRLP